MSTSDRRFAIGPVRPDDLPAIRRLLSDANLPVDGVDALIDNFVVARPAAQPASPPLGAGAVEDCGHAGLLRSVIVHPDARGLGIGHVLTNALIRAAGERGLEALYLLTETAESFFERAGFEAIAREDAPESIRGTDEFRSLCPESAVLMRLVPGEPNPPKH